MYNFFAFKHMEYSVPNRQGCDPRMFQFLFLLVCGIKKSGHTFFENYFGKNHQK